LGRAILICRSRSSGFCSVPVEGLDCPDGTSAFTDGIEEPAEAMEHVLERLENLAAEEEYEAHLIV
jgi:hypothetical protein